MKRIRSLLTNYFKNPFFLVHVHGESGWPILVPGKKYVASHWGKPKKGDFIVFNNPRNTSETLIKRVVATEHGGYRVESMVSWGSSSRDFGLIEKKNVFGKILFI